MLVLARKLNETIRIGDQIEVMVVDIQHGVVKLGINAPRDVPVTRKELIPKLKFDQRVRQAKLGRD